MRSVILVLLLGLLALSCQSGQDRSFSNPQDSEEYEVSEFTYIPGKGKTREKLCDVKYYVSGDTLFTSEKYHGLSLFYSTDNTNDLSYEYMVFFDIAQKPNKDGWYQLTLKDADIPRIPGAHLSAIIMRNYFGELLPDSVMYVGWPDAVLYNTTQQIRNGQEKKELTPQLSKLLPYIK